MVDYVDRETVVIDDLLKQKVLSRLGKTSGVVKVSAEKWNLGFCDTCSWDESGFAVYVDDVLVYPNDDVLNVFGGYVYADSDGFVEGDSLTVWGHFFNWLDNDDLMKVSELEDDFC